MTDTQGTRAQRQEVRVPAAYVAGGGFLGNGRIRDLSVSGARIEEVDARPGVGTPLVLALSPLPGVTPVKMFAQVVRATETGGFAVEFHAGDPKQRLVSLMMLWDPFLGTRPPSSLPD